MYCVIMGHLGNDAVAANSIAYISQNFVVCLCYGFGLCCDAVTLWGVTIPLGCLCAYVLKLPVPAIYFLPIYIFIMYVYRRKLNNFIRIQCKIYCRHREF